MKYSLAIVTLLTHATTLFTQVNPYHKNLIFINDATQTKANGVILEFDLNNLIKEIDKNNTKKILYPMVQKRTDTSKSGTYTVQYMYKYIIGSKQNTCYQFNLGPITICIYKHGKKLTISPTKDNLAIVSCNFSSDEKYLLINEENENDCCEGYLHIWSLKTGALLTTFDLTSPDNDCDCAK